MALNTYSDISSFVNTIYEDALFTAREQTLMPGLVTVYDNMRGMAVRQVNQYNAGTAVAIGESDDLQSKAFTPSSLSTLTPAEVGLQFFMTDQRLESDPSNVRNDAALELGNAIADNVETNLLSNFSSLTGGTVGAAGTAITWGHFFAALSVLRGQKAPFPYACVLHPYQWHVLGKAVAPGATVTNAPGLQDAIALRNFYVGSVSGVDIYTSSNITIDSGTDAYGAIFSRQAMALDLRRAPRLEPERDASRRGWELNMTAVYAYGVWRPAFGVQMLFDCATPTS